MGRVYGRLLFVAAAGWNGGVSELIVFFGVLINTIINIVILA